MKLKLLVVAIAAATAALSGNATAATDETALKETLIQLEQQTWEAWKNRDGKFFQDNLSDDHVEIHGGGRTGKADVVAGVASPACTVKTYALDNFQLTVIGSDSALLSYHAAQDTTCGSYAVPSPVWVSSLWVKRDGRWANVLFQQTPTKK
jgi:hypothetical protein